MDYGEIINSSFRLAWRYKSLWLFGLFAFGVSFPSIDWQKDLQLPSMGSTAFEGYGTALIALIVLFAVLFGLIMLLLNAISTPALVDAVNRITRGGEYRFKTSLQTGIHYMWRTLALMILAFFAMVVLIGILAGIAVIMFKVAAPLGVLSLLFILPLLLFIIFVVTTILNFAFRSIVVRDCTIAEGLGEGMELLKRNFWPCIVMALIYIGLAIVVGIGALIVGVLVVAPFVALALMSKAGMIAALVVGLPTFWLVMLPISGFLGTAFETMYTIFYFRLYEPVTAKWAPQPNATA